MMESASRQMPRNVISVLLSLTLVTSLTPSVALATGGDGQDPAASQNSSVGQDGSAVFSDKEGTAESVEETPGFGGQSSPADSEEAVLAVEPASLTSEAQTEAQAEVDEASDPANPEYLAGTGAAEDPYILASLKDFLAFRDATVAGNAYEGAHFKLSSDIDLSSVCYEVDGSVENDLSWVGIAGFAGSFDGDGHADGSVR